MAGPSGSSAVKPMSVSNRLLLNRLMLAGARQLEVMVVCAPGAVDAVIAYAATLQGAARYVDRKVGYVRLALPIDRLATLVSDPRIEAYQIDSLSRAAWYRDGPPRAQAELYRGLEANAVIRASPSSSGPELPLLTPQAAKQAGFTADEGMGIDQWLRDHPTYDGRGVTIAVMETAMPEWTHPTMGPARTIDGREVDKVAGILNSLDPLNDDSRVLLPNLIDAATTWARVNDRTYILPRAGQYRFGLLSLPAGGNLVRQFGVLRSQTTNEVWVDTDGDADFRHEQPVVGIDRKFEVRALKIPEPRKTELTFVVAVDAAPDVVRIYPSRGGHQAMTVSVAAGTPTEEGLASGVAPAARVLLVRMTDSRTGGPSTYIEGALQAAARPDVDILDDSYGYQQMPDTARDFAGLIFTRLIETYQKPVFHAAGNQTQRLSNVSPMGSVFSVGAAISPATFSALYGGGTLPGMMLLPYSSAGPAYDGALKPDFVAPAVRIAAGTCAEDWVNLIPKNAPTARIPACHRLSCCTSSASPYASGLAALLVSAAKQARVDYSLANLSHALRATARFLPTEPAYQQGAGLLDLDAAWRELQRTISEPHITVTSDNHHAMTPYATGGAAGPGLYEAEGWTVGASGTRMFRLLRDSGPASPTAYRVSWTGNDGTFAAPATVALPLHETVPLPVTVKPPTAGIHSAVLNLHDPATDAIVLRTLATIIVPNRLDGPSRSTRFEERLPLMRAANLFWDVPAHTAAISFQLTIARGALMAGIVPSHAMVTYYEDKYPGSLSRSLLPGTYEFVIADPSPGTWNFNVINATAFREPDLTKVSTEEAEYTLTVKALDASLSTRGAGAATALVVTNQGAELAEPALRSAWGTSSVYRSSFTPNGFANQIDLDVPQGTAALVINARLDRETSPKSSTAGGLDLYLYDCSSGECFSRDFALPAANDQRLVIRKPTPGRWVAMVNGAPAFPASGSLIVESVMIAEHGAKTVALGHPLAAGETRQVAVPANDDAKPGGANARVYELFDQAVDRGQVNRPWVGPADIEKVSAPTALGRIYVLPSLLGPGRTTGG